MAFLRRDRKGPDRFLRWRIGITFLAMGVWAGAVVIEERRLMVVSIALLLVVLALGAAGRRIPRE